MSVVRVHASPDPPGLARVRARLEEIEGVVGVTLTPGDLVGDTVEVELVEGVDPIREGEIRRLVLHAIEHPPAREETVAEGIARLETELALLRARLDPGEGPASGIGLGVTIGKVRK